MAEALAAIVTLKGQVAGVCAHVALQRTRMHEAATASLTLIRLLGGVFVNMGLQRGRLHKRFGALFAFVRLVASVCLQMCVEMCLLNELLVAMLAAEALFASVCCQVIAEQCGSRELLEAHVARVIGTNHGSWVNLLRLLLLLLTSCGELRNAIRRHCGNKWGSCRSIHDNTAHISNAPTPALAAMKCDASKPCNVGISNTRTNNCTHTRGARSRTNSGEKNQQK